MAYRAPRLIPDNEYFNAIIPKRTREHEQQTMNTAGSSIIDLIARVSTNVGPLENMNHLLTSLRSRFLHSFDLYSRVTQPIDGISSC